MEATSRGLPPFQAESASLLRVSGRDLSFSPPSFPSRFRSPARFAAAAISAPPRMATITTESPNPNREPNPNTSGDWTVVSRRRGGGGKRQHKKNHRLVAPQDLTSIPDAPSPWTPLDSSIDAERQSKLLHRIHSTLRRLESSKFYRRFLSRLRNPAVQSALRAARASGSAFDMVAFGLGSIESFDPPRLQLALALLLRRELGEEMIKSIHVFDPVLSATECSVLEALGWDIIPVDERGRRAALGPTLFYMPHCEAALYDNVLSANWAPARLNRVVVLGNSFGAYERYVTEMVGGRGSVAVKAAARHVLGVRKYVKEFEIEDGSSDGGSEGGDDDDDGFFKAFQDISWHFFKLDDDTEMNFV